MVVSDEIKWIRRHSAPLHPILISPNNGILFYSITFRPSKQSLMLTNGVWCQKKWKILWKYLTKENENTS